ncbi:LRR receptor-like kinase [Medicago truncatula]|uniref:LRR receptor-like kinase n=1 Tax=Medicago truncatula TaxID=3880 RepID=A0A072UXK2_MEDTR|nr:LRR receptor-like kinase [Medicago truncatula]
MCNNPTVVRCNENDRETLLTFNQGITDSLGWISTWSTEKDCCGWEGVHCDNITGRVTKIDLKPNFEDEIIDYLLKGEMNLCILELEFLSYLDLSHNYFGEIRIPTIKHNITHSSKLVYLDLSYSLDTINNLHWLYPLSSLKYLTLSWIDLHKETNWPQIVNTLPSLLELQMSHCNLNNFPSVEHLNLSSIVTLDLSYNNFTSHIPDGFFNLTKDLTSLDLSYSNIHGEIPSSLLNLQNLRHLDLSNNQLQGSVPDGIGKLAHIQHLDLSENQLQGFILSTLGNLPSLNYLSIGSNNFSEDISNLTLNCSALFLDHNSFTGGLPNISPIVEFVDLSYNSFSGSIPHSWKNLKELTVLNLWSNRLSGEVPLYCSGWKQLRVMNLGENEFYGTIPIMMSQNLEVVILRDNRFEGTIPPQLFNLSDLFHLDLAHNKLSGSLPHSVYNLTHMVTFHLSLWYSTTIDLFIKGQDYVYHVSPDRRTIDLSSNSLSGEVTLQLFRLVQIQTLNLSHNNLTGTIPKLIGDMKNMESLDLSNNKFYGEIPQSMSFLTFLDYLNLSYNSFDGKIPIGTQLQSFNASSYNGNPKLCGAPLNNCTIKEENPTTATPSTKNEDYDSMKDSLYLGMGVGFAVGFWGICGSIFLIRKCRHAYFRFIDRVAGNLYVTLVVKLNSFRRN